MSKLPTAEETLNKIGLNGGYYVEPKIAIQAIESHTAAHTAALREKIREISTKLERHSKFLKLIASGAYDDYASNVVKQVLKK